MTDLEQAAEAAVGKVEELSSQLEQARATLARVAQQLAAAQERSAADAEAIAGKAAALGEASEAHVARLGEEAGAARAACGELQSATAGAAGEWLEELQRARAATSALGDQVAQVQPQIDELGTRLAAGAHELAGRAAAIEGQLQEALAMVRGLLEEEVRGDLQAIEEAVAAHAGTLEAHAHEVEGSLDKVYATWEEQLQGIEEMLDQELAAARQHAAEVVTFSLARSRRVHAEGWEDVTAAATALDGLLQKLAASVAERRSEVAGTRATLEQQLDDAITSVERARGAFHQELATLARYQLIDG